MQTISLGWLLAICIVPLSASSTDALVESAESRQLATNSSSGAEDNSSCNCTEEEEPPPSGLDALPLWVRLILIVVLVGWSGLFSGLTLGLMGLDVIGLQMVINGDDKGEAAAASKIKPVRQRGNELLCCLLLGNVAVNAALAILADKIFTGIAGFFISTGLIVVFGEIIPQATCAQYALQIGSRTVWIVQILMIIFFPLTKPMSMILDAVLGKDMGQVYSTSELLEMVKLQIKLGAGDLETGNMAKQVVEGALNFREKTASEVMVPIDDVYMLSEETLLGYDCVREIFDSGFSRVPVYGVDKHDVRGMLFTKDLMLADPEDEMRLGDFVKIFDRKVAKFAPDTNCLHVLNHFKKGKHHMGLVWDQNLKMQRCELQGCVTIEDIMEEILNEEIVDETDKFRDMNTKDITQSGEPNRIEKPQPNLGVLNPVWLSRGGMHLNPDEVNAVASHLQRTVFKQNTTMQLALRTVKWLISTCEVKNHSRETEVGVDEYDKQDQIYHLDTPTDTCTLVLQGRVVLRVGEELHRSEAGAFRVLAKDALCSQNFSADFNAYVGTPQVRYLMIRRAQFEEAKAKDTDASGLREVDHEASRQASLEARRPSETRVNSNKSSKSQASRRISTHSRQTE